MDDDLMMDDRDTDEEHSEELDSEDVDPDEHGVGFDTDGSASYACWACGEEIVVPIDPTMGERQDYVEDCPVCCRPNEIHVELDFESGDVRCWNDPEG